MDYSVRARDAAIEAKQKKRNLLQLGEITRTRFEGTRILGNLTDIKTTKRGDMVISISVPYEYRQNALELYDAFNQAIEVVFNAWKPHEQTG